MLLGARTRIEDKLVTIGNVFTVSNGGCSGTATIEQ